RQWRVAATRGRFLLHPLGQRLAEIGRRTHRRHACLLQRRELARRGALAARGDRSGVAHALARWRRGTGDEAVYRLGHVLCYELGGLFFGAAADLADQDDASGLRIVLEHL